MAAVPEVGRATRIEPPVAPAAAFTQDLYERYARQLLGFCFHKLGNREEAEDAVQQTFLNAFRGLKRGIVPEAESAWLFKIAENVCLTRRRSSFRRGRVEAPSDVQALQDFVAAPQRMGTDELMRLQDALADMPATQRRAILLREWQGLSYREIADEMGLTQPAVETLIFRARRSLADGLERPPESHGLLARLRTALDWTTAAGALKALLAGAGTAKAVATTAAAVTVAGAVIAAAPEPRGQEAPRTSRSVGAATAVAGAGIGPAPAVDAAPSDAASVTARRRASAPRGTVRFAPAAPAVATPADPTSAVEAAIDAPANGAAAPPGARPAAPAGDDGPARTGPRPELPSGQRFEPTAAQRATPSATARRNGAPEPSRRTPKPAIRRSEAPNQTSRPEPKGGRPPAAPGAAATAAPRGEAAPDAAAPQAAAAAPGEQGASAEPISEPKPAPPGEEQRATAAPAGDAAAAAKAENAEPGAEARAQTGKA